jgi:hypothetical protein
MSILRGHENLQPKAIVGFDMGYALVDCGNEVKRYRLCVGPGGNLTAKPEEPKPVPVDQIGEEARVRRFSGIDQPIQ